jgi:hypothetical protein
MKKKETVSELSLPDLYSIEIPIPREHHEKFYSLLQATVRGENNPKFVDRYNLWNFLVSIIGEKLLDKSFCWKVNTDSILHPYILGVNNNQGDKR